MSKLFSTEWAKRRWGDPFPSMPKLEVPTTDSYAEEIAVALEAIVQSMRLTPGAEERR